MALTRSAFRKRFAAVAVAALLSADAAAESDLFDLTIEQLMGVEITSASGLTESLRDAPAAMIVLTREDFEQRGYTDLGELFADLPGFDSIVTNGSDQVIAYQRGYRTPFMQRTLLRVNGVIDNSLWAHAAVLSRQYPLRNIERIEVLYGPAGAIYGPNAFLGVINLFTRSPTTTAAGEHSADIQLQHGSFDTWGADLAFNGAFGGLSYALSLKAFQSDEAGLDDYAPWGFAEARLLADRRIWGAVLDREYDDIAYGRYADRSENYGVLGEVSYGDFKLGLIDWQNREGYGMQYAFDHGQPNQSWNHDSFQVYLDHQFAAHDRFDIDSQLKYRTSRIWGGWAEAFPDPQPDDPLASLVSISDWNSISRSWEARQNYDWRVNDEFRLTAGLKYERKELTKAYEICGYYASSYCAATASEAPGPHGFGPGIYRSGDPLIPPGPNTARRMASSNLANTHDRGGFVQGIFDRDRWRLSAALRVDDNSSYGTFVKPRASAIYRISKRAVAKLLYGEAFQEPSPLHLFGGYQGRDANPDLQPEEVRNVEAIFMLQHRYWLHDVSLYYAEYDNVIKEEAENAGQRRVHGIEYRGKFQLANPFNNSADLSGYLYYSHTRSRSSIRYDHAGRAWVPGWEDLGDIAPHKLNLGLNIPFNKHLNLNLRANWVSIRDAYLRNPLRAEGRAIDAYTTLDLNLRYRRGRWGWALKVLNLFDREYYHPGVEQADSGDDFFAVDGEPLRARGFRNSLLPQVGRHFLLTLELSL
jgi:iron complex outermembrane receptor protein